MKLETEFTTIENRTIYFADNLEIVSSMESESVDLIYLDPPFCKGRTMAALGKKGDKQNFFKDAWSESDIKKEWLYAIEKENKDILLFIEMSKNFAQKGMSFYLIYIAVRLIEFRRILKKTASIYFHSDPSVNSYIKIIMDMIFGVSNFQNEIVWCYKSGGACRNRYAKKHDTILFYSKTNDYYYANKKEKSYHGADYTTGNKKVSLHEDENGKYTLVNMKDYWDIPMMATSSKQRVGYPTQKPAELISRIIECSTKKGGIVLDPFAGSGTSAFSAETLSRRWIAIDISKKACDLIYERMKSF